MMVSVCCLAYNHVRYIRDALEGFVSQVTDFDFEVLVHDDCSTDGTADIIRQYAERYPALIRPFYEAENQYSRGVHPFTAVLLPHMKGRYVAVCEGDDCWLDPRKLQKQVDYLEAHPDTVGVFANVEVVDGEGHPVNRSGVFPRKPEHEVTLEEFMGGFYHAIGQFSTLLHRNYFAEWTPERLALRRLFKGSGDVLRSFELLAQGRVHYMGDVMARYRYVTQGGDSWSARARSRNMNGYYYYEKKSLFEYAEAAEGILLRDAPESRQTLFYYIAKSAKRALKGLRREDAALTLSLCRDFIATYGLTAFLAQLGRKLASVLRRRKP